MHVWQLQAFILLQNNWINRYQPNWQRKYSDKGYSIFLKWKTTPIFKGVCVREYREYIEDFLNTTWFISTSNVATNFKKKYTPWKKL